MREKRASVTFFCFVGALSFLVSFSGFVGQAAATITVTNLGDSGSGSLREAIEIATPGETINFGVTGTIMLTTGDLSIWKSVSIDGPGENLLTISGNNVSRVLTLENDKERTIESAQPNVTISGLTIKHGVSSIGGGIANYYGVLEMIDCTVCSCYAGYEKSGLTVPERMSGLGGGIYNNWDLILESCTLFGNTCDWAGGAIANDWEGIATLTDCEIFENSGTGERGGAGIYTMYLMDLIDCTIRDNGTNNDGGGILNAPLYGFTKLKKRDHLNESAQEPGLSLRGCTITGNTANDDGGGIYNEESAWMRLVDCTIASNRASDFGGGIDNRGYVELDSCTIKADTCGTAGGGMANWWKATLDMCTVSGNSGTGLWGGGGIYNSSQMWTPEGATFTLEEREKRKDSDLKGNEIPLNGDAEMVLTNCTISGNETWVNGGGIYNDYAKLRLVNCTVTDNSAGDDKGKRMVAMQQDWGNGGGIFNGFIFQSSKSTESNGPVVELKNTIVAGNRAIWDGPDCLGSFESYGYNLIGDMDGWDLFEMANFGTNVFEVDPMLGPLADNGGATFTHALLPGSPALEGGTCVCFDGEPITTDQRGEPRPRDGDDDLIPLCDIGAYEAPGSPPKMHYPQLPDRGGWDVACMFPLLGLADDWLCMESGPVTDIIFWGSWLDDTVGELLGFLPLIYEDIPAYQSKTGYSVPGELLWPPEDLLEWLGYLYLEGDSVVFVTALSELFSWDSTVIVMDEPYQGFLRPYWEFPFGEFEEFDHQTFFQYHLRTKGLFPFLQEEGEIYWLSIWPFYHWNLWEQEERWWGWKTSRDQWNDGAVFMSTDDMYTGKGWGVNMSLDQFQSAPNLNVSVPPYEWHVLRNPFIPNDSLDLAFVISSRCIEEVWVNEAWTGTLPGTEVEPGKHFGLNAFATVGDAFTVVCPGGIVTVYDGTYPEPGLVVTKDGLTIQAGSKPIFDGGGGLGWWIQANNITVLGWEFTNCDPALRLGPHFLGGPITGFVVHDCHFHNDNVNRWALWVDDHSGTVNAENNDWDSCTGPQHDGNPQGQGEYITPLDADVDYDPWLYPCPFGETCLNHMLPGDPDEYLEGSSDPINDWWAVAFYNPGGVAKITSLAFRFFDAGAINVYVFTPGNSMPDGALCESDLLFTVEALLGDSLAPAQQHFFLGLGLTDWEAMTLDSCVTVGAKSWFLVAWRKTSKYPRIIADNTMGAGTHSWIWNAQMGQWKCFPDLEYCVEVCLDYEPGCVTLDWKDITWDPVHPCVCDDYNVTALFRNECNTPGETEVEFLEAPWGLFFPPGPRDSLRCGPDLYTVPANGSLPISCNCAYHHEVDTTDWWSRNIVVRYETVVNFCDAPDTADRYVRRCRRTIWPGTFYADMPGGTYGPIDIPIMNDEAVRMHFDVSVIDISSWDFQLFYHGLPADSFTLDPLEVDTLWLSAISVTDVGRFVIWVEAMKCNGEVGVAEIEFMPYSDPILDILPIGLDSLWVSQMYPCADVTSFFITFTVTNYSDESAYPLISFGMAQWGLFFPPYVFDMNPLVIGGLQTEKVLIDDPMFVWHQEGHHYSMNVVLDYTIVRQHCFEVNVPEIVFYRECRRVIWPDHRWPWEGEVIPIPVFNEGVYEDTVDIAVTDIPAGWLHFLSRTRIPLAPGMADTSYVSIVPQGADPPSPPEHVIEVMAVKGFCDRDTGYVYIEFLPYACLCIPDYLGKVVENLPGKEPHLVPGDTVFVSLMLENDDSVTAVQVDLEFDEDVLEYESVSLTNRSMGMGLGSSALGPGLRQIRLDFTAGPPHVKIPPSRPGYRCHEKSSEDTLTIATVAFIIEDDPEPGMCSNIYPRNLVVAGLPDADGEPKGQVCACTNHGQICFGGYVFPAKCDVDGDTALTLVDILMILRHIIRFELLEGPIDSAGSALWGADANGDRAINILDLMKCINKSVGRVDPKLADPAVEVRVPEEVEIVPRRSVEIPVEIESDEPLAGVLYRMRYDQSGMEIGQPELTERSRSMELNWGMVDDELWVLVSSLRGDVIGAGMGPVLRLPVQLSKGASGGSEVLFEETVVFLADERIVFADVVSMSLKPLSLVPTVYSLSQNYPNPFNPVTTIEYGLPEASDVSITIYNTLGQVVEVLLKDRQEAGSYVVNWNAEAAASGVYFYRLEAGDFTATRRMVLMK